jgi:hypothetical protein
MAIECAIKDTKWVIRSCKWKKNWQYNVHWMCNKRYPWYLLLHIQWPLYWQFFFHLRLLITHLVSFIAHSMDIVLSVLFPFTASDYPSCKWKKNWQYNGHWMCNKRYQGGNQKIHKTMTKRKKTNNINIQNKYYTENLRSNNTNSTKNQRSRRVWRNQPLRNMCLKRPMICSVCRNHNLVLSSFMTYFRVCNKSNAMGATNEAGLVTLPYTRVHLRFLVGFVLLDL